MLVSPLARHLAHYQVPCTLRAAREFLEDLLDSHRLLPLYQELFPAEYAASTASRQRAPDAPFSAVEWEFFTLVDAHLFPVDLDWMETYEERVLYSPLMNISGFDAEELIPTDHSPGWQMLLVLAGEAGVRDTDLAATPFAAVLGRLVRPAGLTVPNWNAFVRLCQAAPTPVCDTPLALALLWHETGNVWLDTDPDRGDAVSWTAQGIRYLTEAYTAARVWIVRTEDLITWLEEAPAHLEEVIALWNQSLVTTA